MGAKDQSENSQEREEKAPANRGEAEKMFLGWFNKLKTFFFFVQELKVKIFKTSRSTL